MGKSPVNRGAPNLTWFNPIQEPPAGTLLTTTDSTPNNEFPTQDSPAPVLNGNHLPKLFQPIAIRGETFHNRLFVSPMCLYSAENGLLTPFHFVHLGNIAFRGPGLLMVEATAVAPEGRLSPQDVGL